MTKPHFATEADFVKAARKVFAAPPPPPAPRRNLAAGDATFFAAAVDIVLHYGLERAHELAADIATDPRVKHQLQILLEMPAHVRSGILSRHARRTPAHPASDSKPRYSGDRYSFESRGALNPVTARRGRR